MEVLSVSTHCRKRWPCQVEPRLSLELIHRSGLGKHAPLVLKEELTETQLTRNSRLGSSASANSIREALTRKRHGRSMDDRAGHLSTCRNFI
jgi:hypothetical protein